jgi:pimeloyl-ACP methyl ester carboxylesterase
MRMITRTALLALLLLESRAPGRAAPVALPATSAIADPAGEWHGTLVTPTGAELAILLFVTRGPDGSLKAELESPDQAPGQRIPVAGIKVEKDRLALDIAMIHATFDGTWVAADQAWSGTFRQGAELPLKLAKGPPPPTPTVAGLDGLWQGKISRNGVDLRLVLHIATGAQGTRISLDSPDQMAFGVPLQGLARDGQTVRFRLDMRGVRYEGKLSADMQRISGTWLAPNQPAAQVDFVRGDAVASAPVKRPQTPQPPFPYRAEEVAFDNPAASGVRLAGTLTLPQGKGPFPAAILITGSGQQDRDETMLGHKPFAVIADYLTRRGIAVLRVDDRGAGKSTGDFSKATSADFATDANAAFAYLRTRGEIRSDAIGFIGHSEGGMIGPIAMATNKQVAFLIMLAGPGTATDHLLLSQRRAIALGMGQSEAQIDKAEPVMAALFKALASGTTFEEGLAAARARLTPDAIAAIGAPPDTDPQLILSQISSPWFRYFLQYDPAPNLRLIRVPVLAMNGSLDRQVLPAENLAAIKAALRDDRDVTILELPGLNHLFQTARTGSLGEYADIEETVAPVALDQMANWINARFGRR